jgi:hypothetical protein
MRTSMKLVAFVLGLGLLGASVAAACTPQAYLTLDKRSYQPGDPVTVTGNQFKPEAATPATVRLSGSVVAETPIRSDGSWTASFRLPAELAAGAYVVSAEARESDGQFVEGLPARIALPVVAPSPAREPSGGAGDRGAPEAASREAPSIPQPVSAEIAPVPDDLLARSSEATRTNLVTYQPEPRLERVSVTDTARPGTADRLTAVLTSVDEGGVPWYALALAAAGLLLAGGAAGALVASRRPIPLTAGAAKKDTRPAEPGSEIDAVTRSDPLEAELQELLTEERAREADAEKPGRHVP